MSSDMAPSEVVKDQRENEEQRAAEGNKGPPSTDRKWCPQCRKQQEVIKFTFSHACGQMICGQCNELLVSKSTGDL